MHDAIEFDRRGVAAAAIVTHVFVQTAQAMAELDGIPDYPYVVMRHPLSSLSERELSDRAEVLAPIIVRLLLLGEGGEEAS